MDLRLDSGGLSPQKRALLERLLGQRGLQRGALAPIPRRAAAGPAPLSHLQEGLWFLDRLDPGQATYNIPCATRIDGPLDAAALERALGEIVARHEILRTVYQERGGRPVQVALPAGPWRLARRDLSDMAEEQRAAEVLRLATAEARRPFDLAAGPVFRAELLRLAEGRHVLLFCIHHIAADGWSFRVFTRELFELYAAFAAGRPSPLAPLALQFADFAAWQRGVLAGAELERLLGFWRGYLDGVAPLELPADRPRPARPAGRGAHHSFALPAGLSERLRALARAAGVTPFVALLAAFKALLHAHSGQTDVVVGSPVACRSRTELEDLIGYFVNVLPFRTDLGGDPALRELLARVDASVAEVHAHQELPFAKLVEELRPPRAAGANPIYQVEFTLLSYEHAPAVYNYGFRSAVDVTHEVAGLVLAPLAVESGVSKFDLVVLLWDVPGGISGTFEYDAERFDADTIAALARRYQRLLELAVERPELRLSELAAALGGAPRPAAPQRPGAARRRRVASEGPVDGGLGG